MAVDPKRSLAPRNPTANALLSLRASPSLGIGVFCASPTVLEAINYVLQEEGLPTLWVNADGTIGVTDPLFMTVEYIPSPFVW